MAETNPLNSAFQRICAADVPLSKRLALFTAAVEVHAKPFATAYQALIDQISVAGAGATAPDVGDRLPPFLLPNHAGDLVSLERCLADGPVVVSFNRGHWCEAGVTCLR